MRYGAYAMRRIAILAALAAVTATSTAHARYPHEEPADAQVVELVALAVNYHAPRGISGCEHGITALTTTDLLDVDGTRPTGRGIDCQIWISRPRLALIRDGYRAGYRWPHVNALREECWLVVHEVRHALGDLMHTLTGVMAPNYMPEYAPAECWAWARSRYKIRTARIAAHRKDRHQTNTVWHDGATSRAKRK